MNERTYEMSKNPSGTPAAEVPMFGESDPPTPSLPSLHLKTLLVPVDFSENSRKAVIYAVRLAQRNNSSLILLHVVEPPQFVRQLTPDYSIASYEEMRKVCEPSRRQSEETLVRLSRDVQDANVVVETSQRIGTSYEEIVKEAKHKQVDLIVIATHGYTGLARPFLARQHS